MNKLIQVAPEWMSPRMMANENIGTFCAVCESVTRLMGLQQNY